MSEILALKKAYLLRKYFEEVLLQCHLAAVAKQMIWSFQGVVWVDNPNPYGLCGLCELSF